MDFTLNDQSQQCMNIGYSIKRLLTSVYRLPEFSYIMIDFFSKTLKKELKITSFKYDDVNGCFEFYTNKDVEFVKPKTYEILLAFLNYICSNRELRQLLYISDADTFNNLILFLRNATDRELSETLSIVFCVLYLGTINNLNLFRIDLY